jgi:IclR family mhp operon transcriptional activator
MRLTFGNSDCSAVHPVNGETQMSDTDQPSYKDVRSLVKGLRLIETLSELGWSKIGSLSAAAGIQRTTTYRLVSTLEGLGYITRRNEDGAVALSPKFAYIAHDLRDDDVVSQFAWPAIFDLTREVLWPSDFASFEGGKVLIRLSTHKISPMSIHRGMIGKERYLLRSALGLAILSAMDGEALESTLSIIRKLGGENAADASDRDAVDRSLDAVRARGYASSAGQTEAKISAIALPVRSPQQLVAGAVNIVFFRSVMTPEQAADRYLDKLRDCVARVENSLVEFEKKTKIDPT